MRLFLLRIAIAGLALSRAVVVNGGEFNPQVMARVTERVEEFMTVPLKSVRRASIFQFSAGFPNGLKIVDRDFAYRWLRMEDPVSFYYGLEDGTFINYNDDFNSVSFREPGESGYEARTNAAVPKDMYKYWISCVDQANGTSQTCTMQEGATYVECVEKCALIPCPDENSQRNCSALPTPEERRHCEEAIHWCPHYNLRTVAPNQTLGFVPRFYSCVDAQGQATHTPGKVYQGGDVTSGSSLGNCYYSDGTTLVERTLTGDYAYCKGTTTAGGECNPFLGVYRTRDYDPRVRGWYTLAKQQQKPVWSSPYPFFSNLHMGITYSAPFYATEGQKKVFQGAFAVDYSLYVLSDFLSEHFSVQASGIRVAIVEAAEPNYVIAASTGSKASVKVLKRNLTEPCPDDTSSDCTVVRIPIHEFQSTYDDFILQRAFQAQAAAGHPPTELIALKESDDIGSKAYVSQGDIYEQPNANMKWRVIVVMPMSRSTTDEILPDSSSFVVLCLFATLGFCICMGLFIVFFIYRREPVFFCSMLNLSSFTLLGANTNEVCMARMWLFNALLACALSPLFIKVWRMYTLLDASAGFRRVNITHFQTFLYCLPIILLQIIILLVFSLVDPPRVTEILGVGGGFGMQRILCEQQSGSFFYTQLAFDGILILIGCVLAILTRNLDPKFGEAKQLAFAMYNIAFTGIVIIVVLNLSEMEPNAKAVMHAGGLCWGTAFSSCAFVLPRLLAVLEDKKSNDPARTHPRNKGGFTVQSTGNHEGRIVPMSAASKPSYSCDESVPPWFSTGNMMASLQSEVQNTNHD